MASSLQKYGAVAKVCAARIKGFQVKFKAESLVQRLIGLLIFAFNPKYLSRFTTTFYPRVYFPSRAFIESGHGWRVLAHEYVHLWDTQREPLWFRLSYLMPQVFALGALGALGAFWTTSALWCLCFLVFLLPWPSPWRVRAELRGYTMNLAIDFWQNGEISETTFNLILDHLTGPSYYWPAWRRKRMADRMDAEVVRIVTGRVLTGPGSQPYSDVYNALKQLGAVRS